MKGTRNEKQKKKNERCPIALKLGGNKMKSKGKIKKKKKELGCYIKNA